MSVGLNTILVLMSAASIGMACSIIGTYMMLYKKSLVSDAVSHATLPGIALGFILAYTLGLNDGKFLPLLLAGGALTGLLCAQSIEWITKHSRLYEDTAIASALAFFFGLGVLLFSIVQNIEGGNKSGLDGFLFGQIAGTTSADAALIIIGSLIATVAALFYNKKFVYFSFDKQHAELQAPSLQKSRTVLMFLMMTVVCLGLKTVGAILVLALMAIPAASARLLHNSISGILITSVLCGVLSALAGAITSLHIENLPTGPAIILILFSLFCLSAAVYKIRENYG